MGIGELGIRLARRDAIFYIRLFNTLCIVDVVCMDDHSLRAYKLTWYTLAAEP